MVKPVANPDQPAQAQTIDAQLENARPEDARPEDDWDSHWSTFDALSQANPAGHWRHRVLLKLLGLNHPKTSSILTSNTFVGR